ncbi:flagellar basal body L-ring protein FlgH [bacterium]|nr:flagellar basal body L-ring protein FlgH [bacterium]
MTRSNFFILVVLGIFTGFLSSCSENSVDLPKPPTNQENKQISNYEEVKNKSYRNRKPIPVSQSRYEGSLWVDEASWGNLLRDHRARFRGDLVKITNLQDVITVAKPKDIPTTPVPTPITTAGEKEAGQATQVIEAMTGMEKATEEQNEVLGSLRSISAYVQSVLPNGNMVIVGEKVDYRQQNTIRYVTTVKGIIRPVDVNEANEVPAIKLARFEPKIKRQMLAKSMLNLAPLIGQKKAGLLDRISHIATPGSSQSQPVSTQ